MRTISRSGSLEMIPRGTHPLSTAAGVCRVGRIALRIASIGEPGNQGMAPRSIEYFAPAERSASPAKPPRASCIPSKVSPAEWATMNHGGSPAASRVASIEPAEVPTM